MPPLKLTPSRGLYLPTGTGLILATNSRQIGTTVTLNGWYVDVAGVLHQFTVNHVVAATNTVETDFVSLGECWLIGFTIRELAFSSVGPTLYAAVFAGTTIAVGGPQGAALAGGYLARGAVVGWPGGHSQPFSSLDIGKSPFFPNAPAPGAEIGLGVSGFGCHTLDYVCFQLITSAAVAVRTVALQFQPGTVNLITIPASATQIASITRNYTFIRATTLPANTATETFTQLPTFGLCRNDAIVTVTTNLQAGDQFAIITLGGDFFQDMT